VPGSPRAGRRKCVGLLIAATVCTLAMCLLGLAIVTLPATTPSDETEPQELSGLTVEFSTPEHAKAVEEITVDEQHRVTQYHVTTENDEIWAMNDYDTGVHVIKVPNINDTDDGWICYMLSLTPDLDFDFSADDDLVNEMPDEFESDEQDVEIEEPSFAAEDTPIDDASILGPEGQKLCSGIETFMMHLLDNNDYEDEDDEEDGQLSDVESCRCSPVIRSYNIDHSDRSTSDDDLIATLSRVRRHVQRQHHSRTLSIFGVIPGCRRSRQRRQASRLGLDQETHISSASNARMIDRYGRRQRPTPAPRVRRQLEDQETDIDETVFAPAGRFNQPIAHFGNFQSIDRHSRRGRPYWRSARARRDQESAVDQEQQQDPEIDTPTRRSNYRVISNFRRPSRTNHSLTRPPRPQSQRTRSRRQLGSSQSQTATLQPEVRASNYRMLSRQRGRGRHN